MLARRCCSYSHNTSAFELDGMPCCVTAGGRRSARQLGKVIKTLYHLLNNHHYAANEVGSETSKATPMTFWPFAHLREGQCGGTLHQLIWRARKIICLSYTDL